MDKPAIDLDEVLERVQNDYELLLELFDIFETDYAHKKKELDSALQKRDFEQIKNISHSMKGAAGNISAQALFTICAGMEDAAEGKELDRIATLMADLEKQYPHYQKHTAELKERFKK